MSVTFHFPRWWPSRAKPWWPPTCALLCLQWLLITSNLSTSVMTLGGKVMSRTLALLSLKASETCPALSAVNWAWMEKVSLLVKVRESRRNVLIHNGPYTKISDTLMCTKKYPVLHTSQPWARSWYTDRPTDTQPGLLCCPKCPPCPGLRCKISDNWCDPAAPAILLCNPSILRGYIRPNPGVQRPLLLLPKTPRHLPSSHQACAQPSKQIRLQYFPNQCAGNNPDRRANPASDKSST